VVRALTTGLRQWACAQATRRVLDVAVGTGRNLGCYPTDVRLTGVELSPGMLARAQGRAETLQRSVDLRLGDDVAGAYAEDLTAAHDRTYARMQPPPRRTRAGAGQRVPAHPAATVPEPGSGR